MAVGGCTTLYVQVVVKVGIQSCGSVGTSGGNASNSLVLGIGPGVRGGVDFSGEVSAGSQNGVTTYGELSLSALAGPDIDFETSGDGIGVSAGTGVGWSLGSVGVIVPLPESRTTVIAPAAPTLPGQRKPDSGGPM